MVCDMEPRRYKITSGHSDNTLKIWNVKTIKCESTLRVLKLVRFFFPFNFHPLPELFRVLTHLIGNDKIRSIEWNPDGKNIVIEVTTRL
jgi:WD40 repeat protein